MPIAMNDSDIKENHANDNAQDKEVAIDFAPGPLATAQQSELPLILDCYLPQGQNINIRPATQSRAWMDATPDQYAYRCLPLNIANSHGWELLCPSGFSAVWNGDKSLKGIQVVKDDPDGPNVAISHFGSGILTFHVSGLMRTEPGYDLWVSGPINLPKAGIYGLTGLVETDWLPFTFTMNWLFTDKNREVRFEKDEPFCSFFPIPRGLIEKFDPILRPLEEDSGLSSDFNDYAQSRKSFNRDLSVDGSEAQKRKWQKTYFQGPDTPLHPPHRTRLKAKPFRRTD